MTDDQLDQQDVALLDVQARLQEVEDLLMSMGCEGFAAQTANGSFDWRLSVPGERPKQRKAARRRR